ncbi:MAG: penicillin-binding protein 2 [Abditibacteriales bacterium]|nr:penicillin-binding protein 2 [Abditibacteriales bacterium]MDW8364517.1 penicillin-binding protein 2 [Abditibacteriales bacterium]
MLMRHQPTSYASTAYRRARDYVPERLLWRVPNVEMLTKRTRALRVVLLLVFLSFAGRLWYLQVYRHEHFAAAARANRVRRVPLPPPRGIVFDRHGKVLATSRCVNNVAIVPAALPDARREEVLRRLAFLLRKSPQEVTDIFDATLGRPFEPVTIAEQVDMPTVVAVEENRPRLPGVLIVTHIARHYVHGRFAAHLLGHIGEVTPEELARHKRRDVRPGDVVGKVGVERQFDAYLIGARGSELVEVDASGQPVRPIGRAPQKPGHSVFLTIDVRLQRAAEEGLNAAQRPGAVAVVDVRSGDVLALASKPDFDPNQFGNRIPAALWQALMKDKRRPLYNRAIAGLHPPGSTFKLITALAGLERGAITPSTTYVCPGGLQVGRYYKRCWKAHGACDLYKAIAASCDVYFYQVSRHVGPDAIAHVARRFGLGQKTGIDLAGEAAGLIPTPAWKKKRWRQEWFGGDTLNMAIGQGYVQATPLQMACMTAAIANGGTFYRPHLLKKVVTDKGKLLLRYAPQGRSTRSDLRYLDIVRRGMRDAVTAPGGTAHVMNMPHVTVAGKTGSAEDARTEKPHAWFVCFAPYTNPQIALCVMLEAAGHGGTEAAPIARKILEVAFPHEAVDG